MKKVLPEFENVSLDRTMQWHMPIKVVKNILFDVCESRAELETHDYSTVSYVFVKWAAPNNVANGTSDPNFA